MFTIHWYSLLVAIAALTSISLAVASVTLPSTRTRATRTFLMLNIGVACWTAAYLIQIEASPAFDPALAAVGTWLWWLNAVKTVGLATTPIGWFMFAAAQTRRYNLTRGPWLWSTIAFWAYTVLSNLTNPLHLQLLRSTPGSTDVAYGPLMFPYLPWSWVYLIGGTWLLASGLWRLGDPRSRRRALIIGGTILMPLTGGILYTLRHLTGLNMPINPAPVLFSLATVVVAFDVFRSGLADIVPLSAAQAFQAMSDIAIVTDTRLVVLTANEAARAEFPSAEQGADLGQVLPEAARHARDCLSSDCEYLPFELSLGGKVYWGRVYPTRSRSGSQVGCVVMLSDITDLRYAQNQLSAAIERREAGTVVRRG